MYIIIAIVAFGILIFIHELGHFLAAKACGVKVLEFALGMGPRILHKQGRETDYSLRLFPVGGFCAMEGEDEDSPDPRAFANQSVWRRLLILVSGAGMNFLLGLFLVCILFADADGFTTNRIDSLYENCPYEGTLQAGDQIRRVNGERVYFTANFTEYVNKNGDGLVDLVLVRDGRRIRVDDYPMVPVEYPAEDGGMELKYGIVFSVTEANIFTRLEYSWYSCLDFVRMVRLGLVQLFTGQAAVKDMTGVVGIVDIINETGQSASTPSQGLENIVYLVAFIAVNLAVMNMLPIPALDGGRVVTLLITAVIEKLAGHRVSHKLEGYIHYGGLILLLGLMVLVMYNDIARIIAR